jgi:hypothetical protein
VTLIAGFACLILAIAIGCAAMEPLYRGLSSQQRGPRWAAILLAAGAGAMFGIGATSILFFLTILLVPRFPLAELLVEIAALTWLIYRIVKRRKPQSPANKPRLASNLSVAGALGIVLMLATAAMDKSWDLNSQGNWDAWAIWNLRAKFLAAPELAARAWSPLLSNTHPEYPLLLSAAIARCWTFSGAASFSAGPPDAVPIAIAYVFFLALIAAVTGGVAIARGAAAGSVAGLTLACTAALLHEVPSQYADVPIAAYMACAAVFVLLSSQDHAQRSVAPVSIDPVAGAPRWALHAVIWAGVFAGFALWTKDEGALFCLVLLALLALFLRRDILLVILGMLPGGLIYLAFKLFLAPRVTTQFAAGTLARLADSGRWGVVLGGVTSQIVSLGGGWFHPLWIWVAYAIGVRFRTDSRRDAYLFTALAAVILGGYAIAMVTSPNDVLWQTNTAAGRLVVQWWPLTVIALMVWLRPAEEWIVEPAQPKKKRR